MAEQSNHRAYILAYEGYLKGRFGLEVDFQTELIRDASTMCMVFCTVFVGSSGERMRVSEHMGDLAFRRKNAIYPSDRVIAEIMLLL